MQLKFVFLLDDPSKCNSFLYEWIQKPENKHLVPEDEDNETEQQVEAVKVNRVSFL